eukprot:TRINITY_DN6386_c0_g1_i1.p1 TRINITY_DN6386_c0_g1~~TRINITY_DN6386_c0_g1_i1.p1  ORF type:complete len:477 (-),score=120.49 TRINITY_DN6386_c0_g1_i1:1429-2859(-)
MVDSQVLATTLMGVGAGAGFLMAFGIGANDFANALGTSVGSGALSMRNAIILGGLAELIGCLGMGAFVSGTLKGKIVDPSEWQDHLELFVIGMFCALVVAAVWLVAASALGLPISTTQTIVGGIMGFGMIEKGWDGINYKKLLNIFLSWIVTPIMGGVLGLLLYMAIKYTVLRSPNRKERAYKALPIIAAMAFAILFLFLVVFNLQKLWDTANEWWFALTSVFVASIVTALIFQWVIVPILRKRDTLREQSPLFDEETASAKEDPDELPTETDKASTDLSSDQKELQSSLSVADRKFKVLQVCSALMMACAHGGNDVGNAVGPFAALLEFWQTGGISANDPVPFYVIAIAAAGILLGLATLGRRVIKTIGEKITKLNYSRGFSAEMAAASTVVLATYLALPVSTTTTLVGSVTGTGFVKPVYGTAEGRINKKEILKIVAGWFLTVCVGALGSAVLYILLKLFIYGKVCTQPGGWFC